MSDVTYVINVDDLCGSLLHLDLTGGFESWDGELHWNENDWDLETVMRRLKAELTCMYGVNAIGHVSADETLGRRPGRALVTIEVTPKVSEHIQSMPEYTVEGEDDVWWFEIDVPGGGQIA